MAKGATAIKILQRGYLLGATRSEAGRGVRRPNAHRPASTLCLSRAYHALGTFSNSTLTKIFSDEAMIGLDGDLFETESKLLNAFYIRGLETFQPQPIFSAHSSLSRESDEVRTSCGILYSECCIRYSGARVVGESGGAEGTIIELGVL